MRDLLLERAAAERGEDVVRASVGEIGPLWDRCPVGCCPNPRADRPALCGQPLTDGAQRVSRPRSDADPAALADLAVQAARAAADLVGERAARGVTVADTKSSEIDVVTEADRAMPRS